MDLALNNLQRLICHKTQPTNQTVLIFRHFFRIWFWKLHIPNHEHKKRSDAFTCQVWLKFCFMIRPQDRIWDFATPTQIFLISHLLTKIFFKDLGSFYDKNPPFCSKREVKLHLKISWHQNLKSFYHKVINNLDNRWQKCIDVQGSYFDWLIYCLNLFI